MTFDTAAGAHRADKLHPMAIIAIITWITSAASVFALIGLLGREMEKELVNEAQQLVIPPRRIDP